MIICLNIVAAGRLYLRHPGAEIRCDLCVPEGCYVSLRFPHENDHGVRFRDVRDGCEKLGLSEAGHPHFSDVCGESSCLLKVFGKSRWIFLLKADLSEYHFAAGLQPAS